MRYQLVVSNEQLSIHLLVISTRLSALGCQLSAISSQLLMAES